MNINELEFHNLEEVAGSQAVIVVAVTPWYEFADGKRTDKLMGYRYDCVCPAKKYSALSVKVEGSKKPVITAEVLEQSEGTNVFISFTDFCGKFYLDSKSGEIKLTAKASAAVLMEDI